METINRIILSFLCGDRSTRTQTLDVELELRSKTNLINEGIKRCGVFIERYLEAKKWSKIASQHGNTMCAWDWNNSARVHWILMLEAT